MPKTSKSKRLPISTASKVTRALFQELQDKRLTALEAGLMVGRNENTINAWRRGERSMPVMDAEALAETLGFEIVVQRKEESLG